MEPSSIQIDIWIDTMYYNSFQSKPKSGIKTLMTNPAFMMIMVANLPAVMGLYIPYMFLPSVS